MKIFLGRLVSPFLFTSSNRRVILIYHAIGNSPWAVSESCFKQQMKWLYKNTTVVPLSELLEKSETTGIQVSITFDDGYDSVHNIALPTMEAFDMSGTVYLNTGMIAESRHNQLPSRPEEGHYQDVSFMNWHQVKNLHSSHWNIGSHGVMHHDLTCLEPNEVTKELNHSKSAIEQKMGEACNDFSYTWGRYSQHLKDQVIESGYLSSVTGEHGALPETFDPFAIPRVDIRQDYNLEDFVCVVNGQWDYLGQVQKLRKKWLEYTG